MSSLVIHENLKKLSFLFGTWKGKGSGVYPTINPFQYTEEISFSPTPNKPVLYYLQKTWDAVNGTGLHSETGFLRAPKSNTVELILAQPSGVASVEEGIVEENVVTLSTTKIERSQTAKHPWVTSYQRRFELDSDGSLHYTLDMQVSKTRL